uniref:Uncharacterized protein n=1 Tax=Aegilops tauschii TaxID=37682 RepID=N1R2U6_AEGTA
MASAGDPLQGQARPGQAYWPPSRVTASAVTTAASSSLEAAAPLKADLRHVCDPSISSLQQFGSRRFDSTRYFVPLRCSGCTHEFDLDKPPVLQEVADFFSGHGIEDFTFSRGRLGILINMQFPGPQIDAVTNDNIVINVFNNLI